jgi:hypothetical protein
MRNNRIKNQEGSAMIISLLVLLVLTMLGTLMLAQSNIETQIAGHDMRSTQALFAAEAGYAEGLARMSNSSDVANYVGRPPGDWATNPGWGTYVVMANGNSADDPNRDVTLTDGLDNDLDGQVDENGEYYPETVSLQGDDAIDYPWVKIEYKKNAAGQVIVYGDHDSDLTTPPIQNLTRGVPVLHVTASGAIGSSGRTVEIEAVKVPVTFYPAAMYTEDDNFKFNGTQWTVSGEDHDPANGSVIAGATEVPGIATTANPNNITAALNGHQTNNIPGEGGTPSVLNANLDVDLQALADSYAPLADLTLSGGNYGNQQWGGLDDYMILNCTGDLHTAGQCEGGGVLIVHGDLFISGQFTWYGLVIVMGDITLTGGGQGVHIYGSTMVQGGIIKQTVGGNADIVYSSETLAKLADMNPYVPISWHEL